jgi:heme/copper-type cytochrome/quinol oxidase subunit 1
MTSFAISSSLQVSALELALVGIYLYTRPYIRAPLGWKARQMATQELWLVVYGILAASRYWSITLPQCKLYSVFSSLEDLRLSEHFL